VKVVGLWRHPVKSMQGEAIEHAELGASGLPFDRRWGVVDVSDVMQKAGLLPS